MGSPLLIDKFNMQIWKWKTAKYFENIRPWAEQQQQLTALGLVDYVMIKRKLGDNMIRLSHTGSPRVDQQHEQLTSLYLDQAKHSKIIDYVKWYKVIILSHTRGPRAESVSSWPPSASWAAGSSSQPTTAAAGPAARFPQSRFLFVLTFLSFDSGLNCDLIWPPTDQEVNW